MMNMIPQNDNFASFASELLMQDTSGGDQNPPLEVPGQNQTPAEIPEKSIN